MYGLGQRYTKTTHDPLLCSVAQGIFWLSTERLSHSTSHLKERGVFTLELCSLATVTFCIDAPVRIVTKSPKVEPLTYILHLSGSGRPSGGRGAGWPSAITCWRTMRRPSGCWLSIASLRPVLQTGRNNGRIIKKVNFRKRVENGLNCAILLSSF